MKHFRIKYTFKGTKVEHRNKSNAWRVAYVVLVTAGKAHPTRSPYGWFGTKREADARAAQLRAMGDRYRNVKVRQAQRFDPSAR